MSTLTAQKSLNQSISDKLWIPKLEENVKSNFIFINVSETIRLLL